MAKPISEQMVSAILGLTAFLAVAGVAAYFEFGLAKIEEKTPVTTTYDATVVSSQMADRPLKSGDQVKESGIFDQTVFLQPVPGGDASALRYRPEELGKRDLTTQE